MAVFSLSSHFGTQSKGTAFPGTCHSGTEGKGKESGRNMYCVLNLCFELACVKSPHISLAKISLVIKLDSGEGKYPGLTERHCK